MIREITRNDRDSFLRLSDEFYKSEAVLHDIPAAYHEAAFDELMRSKEYASAYMIEWEGEIVGYLLTAKTYSREAGGLVLWLEEMYMRPAYRSKGLGERGVRLYRSARRARKYPPPSSGSGRGQRARAFSLRAARLSASRIRTDGERTRIEIYV